jgi:DNA (cytosine-5)-methyltransferase 1
VNVGSTFSGVGGFDLGFERAGMRVVWQAEIDEWCRRVLRWHWSDATIYDDVRTVGANSNAVHALGRNVLQGSGSVTHLDAAKRQPNERNGSNSIDLLCGGFPCQDLSVAGKRAGLAGERSGLFFEFARIADELKPRWIVLENVVGLLSSADGRDFGIVLATLAEIGYVDLCWRVVDARFFGVPQRRRRVFIVGCLGGDGGQAVRALGAGGEGDFRTGSCSWQSATTKAGRSAASNNHVASFAQNQRGELRESKIAAQLTAGGGKPGEGYAAIRNDLSVRRLAPVECERLMSWPDGWTAVDGDKTPDGKRYAACGNGVVANVSEWIGRRISQIEM